MRLQLGLKKLPIENEVLGTIKRIAIRLQAIDWTINPNAESLLTRPVDFVGMYRIEKGEYPVAALREMLLNALVHRTYMGAAIQLRVYDEKLSIWNEGALPQGLDAASLKIEHNSQPRNPKIADACFKSGYIDTWGSGTLKIISACAEAALPEPEIREKDGGVQVTIYRATIGGQVGGQIGGQINLTQRQDEVFKLILANPKISRRELAEKMGINESAIQKHLKALNEQEMLERIGTKKGYWKILDKK